MRIYNPGQKLPDKSEKKLKHVSKMKSKNPRPQNSMLIVLEIELSFQH